MKTIQEAATELYESTMFKSDLSAHPTAMFEAAVKFAEEFWPIQRDKDGFTTNVQDSDMFENSPFLTKDEENEIELWNELTSDIQTKPRYTHWRPITHK